MLQLVSKDLNSFLGKNLSVYVDYIPSNRDDTFCIIVEDLIDIRIQEETP